MQPRDTAFQTLLIAARANQRWAWEALYREYAPQVLGYLRTQQPDVAEELLGETFVSVVRDIAKFDGSCIAFRSWVFRIAHNRLVDAARASKRRNEQLEGEVPRADGCALAPDAADEAIANDRNARVRAALSTLPHDQRAVMYLRYMQDMPHHRIADLLGKSPPAVKMLQQRALAHLATRMRAFAAAS